MAYSQNSKIEASDFNALVGISNASTLYQLNTIWGVGNGNKGYGQGYVPSVAQNASITASDWANLVNTTSTAANHQASTITTVTAPNNLSGAPTGTVKYIAALQPNINTITDNRLNAAGVGATSATDCSVTTAWSDYAQMVFTVTFQSGDKARYFFNAGGTIAIGPFVSPSGTGINALMNSLGLACGTIVIAAPGDSSSVNVAGISYSGISKVGGSGTPSTLQTTYGYYNTGLTTNPLVFQQLATGTPAGYLSSYISVNVQTNGTVGSNSDNGNVITITVRWDEIPNGLAVSASPSSPTKVTLTLRPPSSTYLTPAYGSITVGQIPTSA